MRQIKTQQYVKSGLEIFSEIDQSKSVNNSEIIESSILTTTGDRELKIIVQENTAAAQSTPETDQEETKEAVLSP